MHTGLLLDIGDVIIGMTPEVLDALRRRRAPTSVASRFVRPRRPIRSGSSGSPGSISGDEYWDGVAREAGFDDWRSLFRADQRRGPRRAVRPRRPGAHA